MDQLQLVKGKAYASGIVSILESQSFIEQPIVFDEKIVMNSS